jgi:anaerobic magnesium-protoporphyrin IX monomethyl ester cyclase
VTPRLAHLARRAPLEGPRIALVSLYDVENNAIRLLASLLRRAGYHAVEIYFKDWISNHLAAPTERELRSLVRVLRRERVQLVALSVRASPYYNVARTLTERIHAELDLPVMWGGNHPTLVPEECIPHADLLLRGEGEEALEELARALAEGQPIREIQNLWVHSPDGEHVRNELRPLLCDLDRLPFRDYHSHEHKYSVMGRSYQQGDPMHGDPVFQMMASRGCIYKCSYCYNSTFKKEIYAGQKWYRHRSVDSALAEIKAAREHWDFKRVRFDDEVFILRKAWFVEFCERWPKEIGLPFEIFIEPKLVTEERIAALAKAGLIGVYMGVQASARVNADLYDRFADDDNVVEKAHIFHRHGIYPHFQLIFDDPESTEHDFRAMFDMVSAFPHPFDLYLFSITYFPGHEISKKLLADGRITPYEVEGADNARTFYQHRVNLQYPRPVEETFWISLIQLLSKPFVPLRAVQALTRSRFLARHPWPLIQLAHGANYVKLGSTAAGMALRGEMTTTLVRRWLNFERVITS